MIRARSIPTLVSVILAMAFVSWMVVQTEDRPHVYASAFSSQSAR